MATLQRRVVALHGGCRWRQWGPQVGALKPALTKANTAVTSLASGSGSLTGVVTAIAGVATAASALFSTATACCPG